MEKILEQEEHSDKKVEFIRMDYEKAHLAESKFVSQLMDLLNKPENTRLFNEVGQHRDQEMKKIPARNTENLVDDS